jgi:hypothetical protein
MKYKKAGRQAGRQAGMVGFITLQSKNAPSQATLHDSEEAVCISCLRVKKKQTSKCMRTRQYDEQMHENKAV